MIPGYPRYPRLSSTLILSLSTDCTALRRLEPHFNFCNPLDFDPITSSSSLPFRGVRGSERELGGGGGGSRGVFGWRLVDRGIVFDRRHLSTAIRIIYNRFI